jgi:hypothetical protein
VGFSGLGLAVSVGIGLLRTLRQRAGQAAEETDRVGVAATSFGEFADALALVRKELWAQEETFYESSQKTARVKVPRVFVERLTDAVCYAA